MAQVLRRFAATEQMNAERARVALEDFTALEILRYEHEPLLGRVWELRHNLTAYDGLYVALAEALELPLLTLDARIGATPDSAARIEMVQDPR